MTPAVAVSTPARLRAPTRPGSGRPAGAARSPRRRTSPGSSPPGLDAGRLLERAGILAVANDLAPATAAPRPGAGDAPAGARPAPGRPVGQSGSGPTLWVLYPSLDAADGRRRRRPRGAPGGRLRRPGRPAAVRGGDRPRDRSCARRLAGGRGKGDPHDPHRRLDLARRPPRSARTARRSPPASSSSAPASSAWTRRRGDLVDGGVAAQAERALRNLRRGPRRGRPDLRRRGEDDDLPRRHGRLRRRQRGLRPLHRRPAAGPLDGRRWRRSRRAACVEIEAIAARGRAERADARAARRLTPRRGAPTIHAPHDTRTSLAGRQPPGPGARRAPGSPVLLTSP